MLFVFGWLVGFVNCTTERSHLFSFTIQELPTTLCWLSYEQDCRALTQINNEVYQLTVDVGMLNNVKIY